MPTLEDRISSKLIEDDNGCWLFTGFKNAGGYGMINYYGQARLAHRIVYMLCVEDPKGLNVLHKCDVPACCNPEHLFLGTIQDNTDDMIAKGRQVKGAAKLSAKDIVEIKGLISNNIPRPIIANRYSVHRETIRKIQHGLRWKEYANAS